MPISTRDVHRSGLQLLLWVCLCPIPRKYPCQRWCHSRVADRVSVATGSLSSNEVARPLKDSGNRIFAAAQWSDRHSGLAQSVCETGAGPVRHSHVTHTHILYTLYTKHTTHTPCQHCVQGREVQSVLRDESCEGRRGQKQESRTKEEVYTL